MKTAKKTLDHSFLPFSTFIEYKIKLAELKASLHIKKASVTDACKILDSYMKPPHKLSDDILQMREE